MKAKTMGRLELLYWINDITEIDYPKLEMCCDGIGYCQVLDAMHPVNAKNESEFSRNLKILDDLLSKLGLEKVTPIDKLARGKFQDNIVFIQWLYTYSSKMGLETGTYAGYEKRLEALSKQKQKNAQMNSYLIPNKAYLNMNEDLSNASFKEDSEQDAPTQREKDIEQLIGFLENDLKKKMEGSWKSLFAIDEVSKERNFFYNLLLTIEQILPEFEESELKNQIVEYLAFIPEEFKTPDDDEIGGGDDEGEDGEEEEQDGDFDGEYDDDDDQ